MVLPKLNREIFMDKSLIAWTHGQLNESKRKLTYRKKIFSEVGKSLFLDRFQSKSLFRTRIKIRVPFYLKWRNSLGFAKASPRSIQLAIQLHWFWNRKISQ